MQANIAELRNRLSYYLRKVARGEVIEVLDRSRPVARLIPISARGAQEGGWAARLRESGLAEGGPSVGVPEILDQDPPGRAPAGVLEALLEERRGGR